MNVRHQSNKLQVNFLRQNQCSFIFKPINLFCIYLTQKDKQKISDFDY